MDGTAFQFYSSQFRLVPSPPFHCGCQQYSNTSSVGMLTLSRKFLSPLSFPTPSFFSLLFSPPFSQLLSLLIPANSTQSIVFDSGTSVILGEQIPVTQVSQSVRNTKAGLRGSGEVAGKPRLGNRMTDEAKERGI